MALLFCQTKSLPPLRFPQSFFLSQSVAVQSQNLPDFNTAIPHSPLRFHRFHRLLLLYIAPILCYIVHTHRRRRRHRRPPCRPFSPPLSSPLRWTRFGSQRAPPSSSPLLPNPGESLSSLHLRHPLSLRPSGRRTRRSVW